MVSRAAGRGRDRAVSTVVDVSLCLLLVSAAVGTLALPHDSPAETSRRPAPAATVEALATGTTSVAYDLDTAGLDGEAGTNAAGELARVAHGSYAGLLAEAAVENASIDGRALSGASDGFERRIRVAVRNVTRATGGRTRIRATWVPYPGAPTRGVVTAGPRPPPEATVAAARMTVPSRFPTSRERARRAARRSGYRGVALVLARATVVGWFPPDDTRLALRGDSPVDALLAERYRRTASTLGTSVADPVGAVEPRRANARLVAALSRRFEADLRSRFDSPNAAADAVRVGQVRVVVMAW
ncbi:DUF7284 family protein [Haloglomus litoreum]|uniref:DUF7284 family protein n=1 Tax=Haloglomus litoreum TaxID=3034026 RepID=UPI0023E7BE49|nr:hypothetical protein [Haloglomus sp. DT116]